MSDLYVAAGYVLAGYVKTTPEPVAAHTQQYVTYTAQRMLEGTGWEVTGSDISVSAADDGFHSSSTDLSGLAIGDWVEISGFENPENNGTFQVREPSSATGILNALTELVTEAAGRTITIRGVERGIGQVYHLEFLLEQASRATKVIRSVQQAKGGGAPEVLTHRREISMAVRTAIIEHASLEQWREFLASVEGGEQFTFDPYGTLDVPVEPHTCWLESDEYAEERLGASKLYRVPFTPRFLD